MAGIMPTLHWGGVGVKEALSHCLLLLCKKKKKLFAVQGIRCVMIRRKEKKRQVKLYRTHIQYILMLDCYFVKAILEA